MMATSLSRKIIPDHGHIEISRLYLKRVLYFIYLTLTQYKVVKNKVTFTPLENESF